jgi:hypothetical protein
MGRLSRAGPPVVVAWSLSVVAYYGRVLWPRLDYAEGQAGLLFALPFAILAMALLVTAAATRIAITHLGLVGAIAAWAAINPPGGGSHNWHSLLLGWSIAAVSLAASLTGAAGLRKRADGGKGAVYSLLGGQVLVFGVLVLNLVARR